MKSNKKLYLTLTFDLELQNHSIFDFCLFVHIIHQYINNFHADFHSWNSLEQRPQKLK